MTHPAPIVDTTPRLQLHRISKRYPGCLANDAIDLSIAPGEIHALLGEKRRGQKYVDEDYLRRYSCRFG